MSEGAPPEFGPEQGPSLPSSQASTLLKTFTDFLTLAIHSLLHHRRLYPPHTFIAVRAFNIPLHQSRHPGVCAWINDAVAAVSAQLRQGAVDRIALAVHEPTEALEVLERWVFDVRSFPAWGGGGNEGKREREKELEDGGGNAAGYGLDGLDENDGLNWADVYEALRGALRRIAYAGESMPLPPEGSTFTLAIELRDNTQAPISHPQPWIPSQPNLQPSTKSHPQQGSSLGGVSTKPVRAVQAGPLFFECWVEQGKRGKEAEDSQLHPPSDTPNDATSAMKT